MQWTVSKVKKIIILTPTLAFKLSTSKQNYKTDILCSINALKGHTINEILSFINVEQTQHRLNNPLISFFIVRNIFDGKFSEKKMRDNSWSGHAGLSKGNSVCTKAAFQAMGRCKPLNHNSLRWGKGSQGLRYGKMSVDWMTDWDLLCQLVRLFPCKSLLLISDTITSCDYFQKCLFPDNSYSSSISFPRLFTADFQFIQF